MVVNASELDLNGVLWAILGIAGGVLLFAVATALVAVRLGRRRFGISSVLLGLVIAIAVVVDAVVVSRTLSGEVTGWDLLWAVGLAGAGVLSSRRLFPGVPRPREG